MYGLIQLEILKIILLFGRDSVRCTQVSSLQEELQLGSDRRQELERQVQSGEGRQRELEREVEEGERSRQEVQGAAQQGKAAEVQVKALQARLTQATQAAATIGQDLAQARTQVHSLSCCNNI